MIKPYRGGPAYPLLVRNTNEESVVVFGETVESGAHLQFTGVSKRDYFAANAPVGFDVALRVWGDPDVNLHDDETRKAFFGVWAMLRGEYADAMVEDGAKNQQRDACTDRAAALLIKAAEYMPTLTKRDELLAAAKALRTADTEPRK